MAGRGSDKPEENGKGETKDRKIKRRKYTETGRAGRRGNGEDPAEAARKRQEEREKGKDENGDGERDK
jgi:hypothetical protein